MADRFSIVLGASLKRSVKDMLTDCEWSARLSASLAELMPTGPRVSLLCASIGTWPHPPQTYVTPAFFRPCQSPLPQHHQADMPYLAPDAPTFVYCESYRRCSVPCTAFTSVSDAS